MTMATVVSALSMLEGIELVAWTPSTGEPFVAMGGRLVLERRARAAPGAFLVWRHPAGGGVLRVWTSPSAARRRWPLEAWGNALGRLETVPRDDVGDSAERLHDVAHLVHRARLELEDGSERGAQMARAALAQIDSEVPGGAAPSAPWRLAERVEAEFVHARALSRRHAGAELVLDVDPRLEVTRDPRLVGRLLRNLLVNALHASPRGARIHVAASRSASAVHVRVRDDGRGLRSGAARRLGSHSELPARGRGIGLHSVRRCARSLGATLEFESAAGAGTTVLVHWNEEPDPVLWVGVPTTRWAERARRAEPSGANHVVVSPDSRADDADAGLRPCSEVVLARGTPRAGRWIAAARAAGVRWRIVATESDERAGARARHVSALDER